MDIFSSQTIIPTCIVRTMYISIYTHIDSPVQLTNSSWHRCGADGIDMPAWRGSLFKVRSSFTKRGKSRNIGMIFLLEWIEK